MKKYHIQWVYRTIKHNERTVFAHFIHFLCFKADFVGIKKATRNIIQYGTKTILVCGTIKKDRDKRRRRQGTRQGVRHYFYELRKRMRNRRARQKEPFEKHYERGNHIYPLESDYENRRGRGFGGTRWQLRNDDGGRRRPNRRTKQGYFILTN